MKKIVAVSKDAAAAIDFASKAAQKDTARPSIQQVCIRGDVVTGTDGYRVHAVRAPVASLCEMDQALGTDVVGPLPDGIYTRVGSVMRYNKPRIVVYDVEYDYMFGSGSHTKFPVDNVNSVLNGGYKAEPKAKIAVNPHLLIEALKPFAKDKNYSSVLITITSDVAPLLIEGSLPTDRDETGDMYAVAMIMPQHKPEGDSYKLKRPLLPVEQKPAESQPESGETSPR